MKIKVIGVIVLLAMMPLGVWIWVEAVRLACK